MPKTMLLSYQENMSEKDFVSIEADFLERSSD
jgi:hypothetical protein